MRRCGFPVRSLGVAIASALLFLPACGVVRAAKAQEPGGHEGGRGRFAGMQRVGGTVTAISGANVTIKAEDGTTYQVVTTDNTRLMRGRGVTIKLSDLKLGDGVMAMGNLDAPNKTLHAAVVMAIDAEQMKQMEEARKQELANLGKTIIAGRVTAIDLDNATMTVERPDGVSETIGFDEGTSFRRGHGGMVGAGDSFRQRSEEESANANTGTDESITLADIKVGDRVYGPGAVKDGRFVPKELTVMSPGAGRRRGAAQQGEHGGGAPSPSGALPPE